MISKFDPLSAYPTKWSNTLKQFVGNSRRIVWVCLAILWHRRLKDYCIILGGWQIHRFVCVISIMSNLKNPWSLRLKNCILLVLIFQELEYCFSKNWKTQEYFRKVMRKMVENSRKKNTSQPEFTCSKLTIEILEK